MQFDDVRLVVWDLDETFWRGTLTEGGIEEYIKSHHDLIVRLAQRGILSSICSKNDHGSVKQILSEREIWEYFVFPSVDWTQKGPRLQKIIDLVKLRPQTVLFIDDNPSNRAEALSFVPELRVAGPEAIAELIAAADDLGKHDGELSRLKQYKMLENRYSDELSLGDDNLAFLRNSDIQVHFEYDVVPHMERIIELINRTNQLNFTKRRLSEASEEAMADILSKLNSQWYQAMLIRVADKYGDYGYVGFVLRSIADASGPGTIEHFCFSCRTLGMEVERWVYNKIGRPQITIAGPVVTDLLEEKEIDWINLASELTARSAAIPSTPEVRLVGSCEIDALSQYFAPWAQRCVMKTSEVRVPLWARKDVTSHLLLPPALWRDAAWTSFIEACGLRRSDFDFGLFDPAEKGTVFIYSPWGDIGLGRYRHKATGVDFAIHFYSFPAKIDELTDLQFDHFAQIAQFSDEQRAVVRRAIAALREDAEFSGWPTPEVWERDLRDLLSRFPEGATVVLLAIPETPESESLALPYNEILNRVARVHSAHVFDISDYVANPAERLNWNHYQRIVYYRLAKAIMDTVQA